MGFLSFRTARIHAACLFLTVAHSLSGDTRVGVGEPETVEGELRYPVYFLSDEGAVAGQLDFDFGQPVGPDWEVITAPGLASTHEIRFAPLGVQRARVLVFSMANTEIPDGPLGWIRVPQASPPDPVDGLFSDIDGGAITFLPGFDAPAILTNPASRQIAPGERVTLAVAIVGLEPTVQWYAGDSGDTTQPVAGAAEVTYETPPLFADARFWVRVTDSLGRTVDSQTAVLTIIEDTSVTLNPTFAQVGPAAGSGTLQIAAEAALEWTALSDAAWLVPSQVSGVGDGALTYTYAANTDFEARTASITVNGATFTLVQEGDFPPSLFAALPADPQSGWKESPWFGFLLDHSWPWIWHGDHGWLYVLPNSSQSALIAYNATGGLGWLFTGDGFHSAEAPFLYSMERASWLLLLEPGDPFSRAFFDYETGETLVIEGDSP